MDARGLAAVWLSRTSHPWAGWTLAALAVVFIAPAIRREYWNAVLPIPKLFTTTAYRSVFPRTANVLVLPVGI